jgi:hypothetical protein
MLHDQEIRVNAMDEGDINEQTGEQVVMEDMEHAKAKNNIRTPKKRFKGRKNNNLSQVRN